MQNKREWLKTTFDIKKAGLFVLVLTVILFLWVSGSNQTVFASESRENSKTDRGKSVEQRIYFENDWVEAGVPLKVQNAPKDATFQWIIKGADGLEKTVTTKENTYTPSDKDMEKLITVMIKGMSNTSASIYYSSLPVVYINNTFDYYDVGEESSDASMNLRGNKTFSDQSYRGAIKIKLRGNSTKFRDKRPFNISLDKKTDLLGMGKNKHWALLANDIDHTLMRNKLLYDFSGAIGMETYSKSENVILIFNNEYYGVYQLCELVNLGSDRVNIYDWEEAAQKAAEAIVDKAVDKGEISKEKEDEAANHLEDALCEDMSWITSPYTFVYDANEDGKNEIYTISDYIKLPEATGGVLLEMDFYAFNGENASNMISNYSLPWYFKSPEYAVTNSSFFNYIEKQVQSFEYALHSTDFIYHDNDTKYIALNRQGGYKNSGYAISNFTAPEYDGTHYSELFDMESLVQNFLVCEYSMNWDSMKNSTFMYKDIKGLFHMGPEWDFDWAWGNINMFDADTWYPTSWQTTENAFTREQYYQTVQWNRCLIRDPYFLVRVYEMYQKIRPTIIEDMIKNGGTIDTYAKELETAAAANDTKWGYTYSNYNSVGFQESLKNMKKFINTRIDWMDTQFESLDTLMSSLNYYKPDKELTVTKVDTKSEKGYAVVTVQVTDSNIASVTFQVNGKSMYHAEVTSGQAVCRIPKSALVPEADILNVIQVLGVNSPGKYIIVSQDEGNYYQVESNYAVFYNNGNDSDALVNSAGKDNMVQETLASIKQSTGGNEIYLIVAAVMVLVMIGIGIWIIVKVRKKKD